MTKIVGIDYSLTGPCIAICDNVIDINETEFHYLTKVKKYEGKFRGGQITGHLFKEWTSEQQRHGQISDWVFEIIGIGYNNLVFMKIIVLVLKVEYSILQKTQVYLNINFTKKV